MSKFYVKVQLKVKKSICCNPYTAVFSELQKYYTIKGFLQ